MREALQLALDEFIHVGVALLFIIALVSVLTGFIRAYIPQDKLQKRLSKTGKFSGLMGALLGVPTPFCSASMVPVSMGMLEMGAPFSMVFSFLLSAPLTNFVVVGFIFAVFGLKVAATYFLIVFIGSVVFGTIIGNSSLKHQVRTIGKKQSEAKCGESEPASCCSDANPVESVNSCCPEETKSTTTSCGEQTSSC
ncbi:permease [Saccharicrinis aurantiacus]|uniref:permease n=1 Tax=Saccharicrinis aurantiacus TaxID=1849719 RepID=UPI002490F0DB|nr:permease [Saccharicrinis aurantiacus]